MKTPLLGVALLLASAGPAPGVLEVVVSNVRSAKGHVLVAVCNEREFLAPTCAHVGSAPAQVGTVVVQVVGVPPGVYAVQAYQDENDNRKLDRNFLGMPTEGMGFSNDPPFRFGPPRFRDAAVQVGPEGGRITLALRYLAG